MDASIEPPVDILTLTDPARAWMEFCALACFAPALISAPRGDGHGVLVLPGFATGDAYTTILRKYLNFLGYRSAPWQLGINTGFDMLGEGRVLLRDRLAALHRDTGAKVSLIGWSLGGIMCRSMARQHPEMVRQVVTLGSPFEGNPAATVIQRLYRLINGDDIGAAEAVSRFEQERAAPPVRCTAIYSHLDGIAPWQNCRERQSDMTSNIQVFSSHLGLPHNGWVLLELAKVLASHAGSEPDTLQQSKNLSAAASQICSVKEEGRLNLGGCLHAHDLLPAAKSTNDRSRPRRRP